MRESEDLISKICEVTKSALERADSISRKKDWTLKKNNVRDALHDYVYAQTKRNPMILPIIMEFDPEGFSETITDIE